MWVHCKNGVALCKLVQDGKVHWFLYKKDDYMITLHGTIWAYPDQPLLGERFVAVMYSNPELLLIKNISGNFQDNDGVLREKYVDMRRIEARTATVERSSTQPDPPIVQVRRNQTWIRLEIFDLDGVLVESRDLHYEALK